MYVNMWKKGDFQFTTCVANNGRVCAVCLPVSRQQDGSMWVILSESQDNRKKALSDRWMTGAQEWEKVKMGETQSLPHWLGESVRFLRVLNRVVLPKHGPGRLRGAACGSPGGCRDSRWGSGEDHLLTLTTRGRLRQRVMGNGNIIDLSTPYYWVNVKLLNQVNILILLELCLVLCILV